MDESSELRGAERILGWITRHHLLRFSRAECYQAVRRTAGIKHLMKKAFPDVFDDDGD